MVSARNLFHEIRDCDESFQLFCSIAAKGETQGGWENHRIAALCPDRNPAPKIAQHGLDEEKHGRLFRSLLKKRGLDPIAVPPETDYCALLEAQGIGLSHERLERDEVLDDTEVLTYLVHSRVTEQRAQEEVDLQLRVFGEDPSVGKAVRMIAADEVRHLSYCHEELLRFGERGYREPIREQLREYAHAEIRVYRGVSHAVMDRMGAILGWSSAKQTLLRAGIDALYAWERGVSWRRMVRLAPPRLANAMAPPVRAADTQPS